MSLAWLIPCTGIREAHAPAMPLLSPSRYGSDRYRQIFIDHWSD